MLKHFEKNEKIMKILKLQNVKGLDSKTRPLVQHWAPSPGQPSGQHHVGHSEAAARALALATVHVNQ